METIYLRTDASVAYQNPETPNGDTDTIGIAYEVLDDQETVLSQDAKRYYKIDLTCNQAELRAVLKGVEDTLSFLDNPSKKTLHICSDSQHTIRPLKPTDKSEVDGELSKEYVQQIRTLAKQFNNVRYKRVDRTEVKNAHEEAGKKSGIIESD